MSKSIIPPIFIQFGEIFILEYTLTPKIDFKPTQRSKEASGTHSCPPILDQLIKFSQPNKFHLNWLQSILDHFLTQKIDFKPTQRSKEASGTHSYPPIRDQHVKIYKPTNFYSIWCTFYFRVLYDLKKSSFFSYNSKNTHF